MTVMPVSFQLALGIIILVGSLWSFAALYFGHNQRIAASEIFAKEQAIATEKRLVEHEKELVNMAQILSDIRIDHAKSSVVLENIRDHIKNIDDILIARTLEFDKINKKFDEFADLISTRTERFDKARNR